MKMEYFQDEFFMPVAPLLKPDDLIKAYEFYVEHERKHPLHVVNQFPAPIEWAYRRDHNGLLTPLMPDAYASRPPKLERGYYEMGPF